MKALKFPILALLTSLSFGVFAGPNDGGGGLGIVCLNPDKTIKSVELLDLWEAREIYKRKIVYQNDRKAEDQLPEIFDQLKDSLLYPYTSMSYGPDTKQQFNKTETFRRALQFGAEIFTSTENTRVARFHGKRLTKTNDAYEDVTPDEPRCEIEQIVRYKDNGPYGQVLAMVNQDLVDHMDSTNQAALWAHESLYAILRKFGERTSLRVRRAVGYAFSGGKFTLPESLISHPYIQCDNINMMSDTSATRTRILMVQSAPNIVGYMFLQVNGMLGMGFNEFDTQSGMSGTIESVYKDLLHGAYAIGDKKFAYSVTDYDQLIDFRVTSDDSSRKATAEVQIKDGPSGVVMTAPQKLTCRLVK
jgi:hypothetical protein